MKRLRYTLRLRREGFAWLAAWRIAGLRVEREQWGPV